VYRSFEERQAADRAQADRIRGEREWAQKAEPVVITGVRIPFWTLVWLLVGITAAVNLVSAVFEWAARVVIALVGGPEQ
jgi:hypothetical protein